MTTDLDTRLTNALTVAAASTTISDDAFTAILRRATRQVDSPSRGTRVAVLGAATAVAATAAAMLVVVDHGAAPSIPAQAPTTTAGGPSGLVAYPELWSPVQLTPGLVSWYRLDTVAADQFTAIESGPAAINMYCREWSAETADSVICNDVFTEGVLPAVTYQDAQSRRIEISTIHDDTTAEDYAVYFSQGKDTAYDAPPLEPEPIQVGDRTGQLIEPHPGQPDSTLRITIGMSPGVFVAVESMGFTLDELVAFAEQLEPATASTQIPLELVIANSDGDYPQLHGAVVDGEVCALSSFWGNGGPHDCTLLGDAELLLLPTDSSAFYAGLVSGDVASITLTYTDGTTAELTPVPQPVGKTQAFAAVSARLPVVSIVAFDQNGNELARQELNPTGVVVPTTGFVVPTTGFAPTPDSSATGTD